MSVRIDETEFVIFDTETTGLDPASGDRVVEIAAIRLKEGRRQAVFEALVNPGSRQISEAAFAVNQITPPMLAAAPPIAEVLPGFLTFIKGACLCSYNAGFDVEFIRSELARAGIPWPVETVVVDILRMARRLLPGLERYSLWFVAGQLGIAGQQTHRALSDVELTRAVFDRLCGFMRDKGIVDFSVFLGLFGIDPRQLERIASQKITLIQEAIDRGFRLRIKYLSGSSAQVSLRDVTPEEIRPEAGTTYLIGYCHLRAAKRSFRLDNIVELTVISDETSG